MDTTQTAPTTNDLLEQIDRLHQQLRSAAAAELAAQHAAFRERGVDPDKAYVAVVELAMQSAGNDTWSGRNNDARRALADGHRDALSRITRNRGR